ncbi:MAG: M23 family metallopeptidase [Chloroflexota bacterium]|nr:M23 family metallopeptidase [Chloroflexota bacterium]
MRGDLLRRLLTPLVVVTVALAVLTTPAAGEQTKELADIGGPDPLSCTEHVDLPPIGQALEERWSPDSTHLAYTHIVTTHTSETVTGFEEDPWLSILDLTTRRTVDLGPGKGPRWSGSGTYLSYWHRGALVVVKAGRIVTELDPSQPATRWVGDQLLYWSGDEIHAWTAAADIVISTVSADYAPAFPQDVADFSADGVLFSITRYFMDGTAARYVGVVKTGQLTPLATQGTTYTEWSPTGETLLVRSDDTVELRGPNGADSIAPLTAFPGPVHGWTPDGRDLLMGKVSPTVPAIPVFDHFVVWDGKEIVGSATLPDLLGSRTFSPDGRYFAGVARNGLYETALEVYRCGTHPVTAMARADPVARSYEARIEGDPRRFVRPVIGYFTQFLTSTHSGIDVAAPFGSLITASDDGVVDWVGWRPVGGRAVCVLHAGGLESCDYHVSLALVKVGQHVARGEPVAAIGMTGDTLGPHVHWEAKLDGAIVDPLEH